jgi:hypothetical protein
MSTYPYIDLLRICLPNKTNIVSRSIKRILPDDRYTVTGLPGYIKWSTCLNLLQPDLHILEKIRKWINRLTDEYAISTGELATDEHHDGELACMEILDTMYADVDKKYCSQVDVITSSREDKPKSDPWCFGENTYNIGCRRTMSHHAYCRYSKLTGEPCVHKEWRLHGSDRVSTVLGWTTIGDVIADVEAQQLGTKFNSLQNTLSFNNQYDHVKLFKSIAKAYGWAQDDWYILYHQYGHPNYAQAKHILRADQRAARKRMKAKGRPSKIDKALCSIRPERYLYSNNNHTPRQNAYNPPAISAPYARKNTPITPPCTLPPDYPRTKVGLPPQSRRIKTTGPVTTDTHVPEKYFHKLTGPYAIMTHKKIILKKLHKPFRTHAILTAERMQYCTAEQRAEPGKVKTLHLPP